MSVIFSAVFNFYTHITQKEVDTVYNVMIFLFYIHFVYVLLGINIGNEREVLFDEKMGRQELELSTFFFTLTSCCHIYSQWIYLLRPSDKCCFSLTALLRKPQQTDGRYRDLLITDTLTFKAVSLCGERMNPTPHPVNPTSSRPSTRLLQKKRKRKEKRSNKKNINVGQAEYWKVEKNALWKLRSTQNPVYFSCSYFSNVFFFFSETVPLPVPQWWRYCPPKALPPPLSVGQLGPGCVGCCCMLRERETVWKLCRRG